MCCSIISRLDASARDEHHLSADCGPVADRADCSHPQGEGNVAVVRNFIARAVSWLRALAFRDQTRELYGRLQTLIRRAERDHPLWVAVAVRQARRNFSFAVP